MEPNKQDWQQAKTQWEAMIVNAKVNLEIYANSITYADKKIAEFPSDEEEQKAEDEEIAAEVKKDLL